MKNGRGEERGVAREAAEEKARTRRREEKNLIFVSLLGVAT